MIPARRAFAGLIAVGLAVGLAGCGSSRGLIPPASANALERDFAEVARAAQQGECNGVRELVERSEADLSALPVSVARALRERLSQGVANLRTVALERCATTSTTTSTSSTTSSTSSSRATTTTSTSETKPTETSSTTTSSQTSETSTTTTPSNGGTPPVPTPPHPPEAGGAPEPGGGQPPEGSGR